MFKRYFCDKDFNRRVLAVLLPIVIQNGITNFVSLLDNIMVGQVGTLQMSGVSIANNLIFVFNLCVFGGAAGAGIFIAQYHGSGEHENIRYSFRYKLFLCLLLAALGGALSYFCRDGLIGLYLRGEGDPAEAARILEYGRQYLLMMLPGLLPFALSNAYSGTLRECGQATVPMIAGVVAVFVNLFLNYVLIFGHFGAPAMGVNGAALATVISRYVELVIIATWTHTHPEKNPFIQGALRSAYIPAALIKRITFKGMPLLINEALWSGGEAMFSLLYSTRGLDVVPAVNICSTIFNLSSVAVISMGSTVGILMGQLQGAGRSREALWDANRKLTAISIAAGVCFGGLLAAISGVFPMLYNTTHSIRTLSTRMILICAVSLPLVAYVHSVYFTMRSGGKTWITFLFDGGYSWLFSIPVALVLCQVFDVPILILYLFCRCVAYFIKCFMGYFMLRRGTWIQNLTTK